MHSGCAPGDHQTGLAGQNEAQRWHHQHHKRAATSAGSYAAQTPQIHYGFLITWPSQRRRALRLCEPIAATPSGFVLLNTDVSHMRAASHQCGKAHGRILHRLINWKHSNAEWRMPSDAILHTLSNLMAKSLCLHATRLRSANRYPI